MKKKILIGLAAVAVLLAAWHFLMSRISYQYVPVQLPKTFDEFYAQKLAKSKELKARPHNEERLIRYAEKTPLAILYIHGYGASRAEGEYVVDKVAKQLKANTYYLRLPGHGTNVEDHARVTVKEHLDETFASLAMMRTLGKKVVVIGMSMGGLIATYAAAERPELVDALVLCAPAYQFAPPIAKVAGFYPALKLITLVMPRRPSTPIPNEADNWSLYWYPNQYTKSLRQMYQLQSLIANDDVYRKVKQPVMLLYYYKDDANQDNTVSVSHMIAAYEAFNNGTANPKSKKTALDQGGHVLLSKYVEPNEVPDYDKVTSGIIGYINSLGWNK